MRLDERAGVGVWIAVMMPGMLMATSMAVEIGSWAAAKASVQRSADVSAVAGAINYNARTDITTTATRQQTAATYAARVAQLNGGAGTAAPSWSASSTCINGSGNCPTLSDNQITVQVVPPMQNSTNAALLVSVQRTVPKVLASFFSPTPVTVTGVSQAELVTTTTTTTTGGTSTIQPCMLVLSTAANDVSMSAGQIVMNGCSIRSNSNVSTTTGATVAADAVYFASGTQSPAPAVTPAPVYNSPVLTDPFLSNSAINTAKGLLSAGAGTAVSYSGLGNKSLSPGIYSGISLSGAVKLTLSAGLYIVNGNISMSGTGNTIDASAGVTIVTSGTVSLSAGTFTLNAPTASVCTGGVGCSVVGSAMISTGNSVTMSGGTIAVTGLLYAPNASLSLAGGLVSPTNCFEIITNTVSTSGGPIVSGVAQPYKFNNVTCTTLGVPGFGTGGSTTTTTTRVSAQLVR